MLYLKNPSQDVLSEYCGKIKTKIKKVIASQDQQIKNVFTELKLEELIKGTPDDLIILNDNIMGSLIPNFNGAEYKIFLDCKDKIKLSDEQKIIKSKYIIVKDLYRIFNYDNFISKSKSLSYFLATKLNSNTCTYCNRLYTNTVIVKDKKTKRFNDQGRITRPQFDHWFVKSKYPILALSFYNLIPSCYVCNSSIKGDAEFDLKNHIHPYVKENKESFKFSFDSLNIDENNVKIIVKKGSKMDNTLKEFKIKEVYNSHSMFELKDLIELRKKYSDNYLDVLFNQTFSVGITEKEIYRLVFGVEPEEKDYHKRPFSKFKKDIVNELLKIN